MGDEDDGRARLLPDRKEVLVELFPGKLVQGGEWLVHEEELGLDREGPRDADPLLHAAAELVRVGVGELGEPDELELLLDAPLLLLPLHLHHLQG